MKLRIIKTLFSALGIFILIIDTKTALSGGADAIELCIRTVIPSLFPFLVLSTVMTENLFGLHLPFLRPLGKLYGIPGGAESLLCIGLVGGYPVGAKCISDAYQDGQLAKNVAHRMLMFCNNAGPAFFFGIIAIQFSMRWVPWALWCIHIVSALLVGIIMHLKKGHVTISKKASDISMQPTLQHSIHIMAQICAWIMLFRISLAFIRKWLLPFLPHTAGVILAGFLELTGGCCQLHEIENPGLRFIIAAEMLAFGGICVAMQTQSVIGKLNIKYYFAGKIIQTIFSTILAYCVQLLFPIAYRYSAPPTAAIILLLFPATIGIILWKHKKRVAIHEQFVYNDHTAERVRKYHVIS